MSYRVTQNDIFSAQADAAVICIENAMAVCEDPVSQALGRAGGDALRTALRRRRFLPVGSACAIEPCALPFQMLFAVGTPQWRNGESNELLVLRRCYEALYQLARETGCKSLAMPFLSAAYYRFPLSDAVLIAREEAGRANVDTIFLAATQELYDLSQTPCRRPEIVAYIGYYRDHAVFQLDNGSYARVDIRPEMRDVNIRPYVEPCYYNGADPSLPPLAPAEIERLRGIYEGNT